MFQLLYCSDFLWCEKALPIQVHTDALSKFHTFFPFFKKKWISYFAKNILLFVLLFSRIIRIQRKKYWKFPKTVINWNILVELFIKHKLNMYITYCNRMKNFLVFKYSVFTHKKKNSKKKSFSILVAYLSIWSILKSNQSYLTWVKFIWKK